MVELTKPGKQSFSSIKKNKYRSSILTFILENSLRGNDDRVRPLSSASVQDCRLTLVPFHPAFIDEHVLVKLISLISY